MSGQIVTALDAAVDPMQLDFGGKLMYALGVAAVGLCIVFLVLIILMLILYLFKLIFGTKSKRPARPSTASLQRSAAPQPQPQSNPAPTQEPAPAETGGVEAPANAVPAASGGLSEEELLLIALALNAYCKPGTRYRIRSFKRI